MADIFISYAKEDRDKARDLARALAERNWTVWWDRQIAIGLSFDEVIERELRACKCAIVLWTTHSVASRWVKGEARLAAKRNVLVPILAEDIDPPLEFGDLQAADLTKWERLADHPEFEKVIRRIEELVPRASKAPSERVAVQPQRVDKSSTSAYSRIASRPFGAAAFAAAIVIVLVAASYFFRGQSTRTPLTTDQPSARSDASVSQTVDAAPSSGAQRPSTAPANNPKAPVDNPKAMAGEPKAKADPLPATNASPRTRRFNTPGFQLTINQTDYFTTKEFEIADLDLNRDFQLEFAIKSERPGGSTRYGIAWNFQPDDYMLFTLHSTGGSGYYSIGPGRNRSYRPFSRFSEGGVAINAERDFDVMRMSRSGDSLIFAINRQEVWRTRDYHLLSNRFAFWAADYTDAVMDWYTVQP